MTTVGFACKIHPRHFFYDAFVIMIKALIFDFGQTLVDSADGFRAAEKKAKSLIFEDLDSEPGGPSWDAFLPCYRRFRKEFHQRSNFSRPVIWQAVYAYFSRKPDPENPAVGVAVFFHTVFHVLDISRSSDVLINHKAVIGFKHLAVVYSHIAAF